MGERAAAEDFLQALLRVDRRAARRALLDEGTDEVTIQSLETIAIPALERIGLAWEQGRTSLAQIYMAGRICEEFMDEVSRGTGAGELLHPPLAIAVLDDHHALGKRLVKSVLYVSGWNALDYGQGLDVDAIVQRVSHDQVEVLLVSVLMLPSALKVKELKEKLDATGRPPKLLVGGAPFRLDPGLWREVGADATGNNASDAVELVRAAMEGLS